MGTSFGFFDSPFQPLVDAFCETIRGEWSGVADDMKSQASGNMALVVLIYMFDTLLLCLLWLVSKLTTPAGLIVLLIAFVAKECLGERYGSRIYEKICGQINCPDPRDAQVCGLLPLGWCIMDLFCPCFCPKYKPCYSLRIVIERANHLHYNVAKHAGTAMDVYVKVWAGTNPIKTTSIQPYRPKSAFDPFAAGDAVDTVVWNEPIDLVMFASIGHIDFEIFERAFIGGDQRLGQCRVKVDGIYVSSGRCSKLTCGSRRCCGPRGFECCGISLTCGHRCCCEYKWPMVIGGPESAGREGTYMLAGLDADMKHEKISNKGNALRYVSRDNLSLKDWDQLDSRFKSDPEIAMIAVRRNPEILSKLEAKMQQDPAMQRAALNLPEPMLVPLMRRGDDAGVLSVYFVLSEVGTDMAGEHWKYPYPFGNTGGEE